MEIYEKRKDPIVKRPVEYKDLYRILRTLRSDPKFGPRLKVYNHQRPKAYRSINRKYPDILEFIRIL